MIARNVKHAIEMSRNDGRKDTSASAFRKIDVDQYSDNNFKEEDADGGIGVPTGPDENEILTLLSQYPFTELSLLKLFYFSNFVYQVFFLIYYQG